MNLTFIIDHIFLLLVLVHKVHTLVIILELLTYDFIELPLPLSIFYIRNSNFFNNLFISQRYFDNSTTNFIYFQVNILGVKMN